MRRSSCSGSSVEGRLSGTSTSSTSPAARRWLFASREPLTRTRFSARRRSAAVREPTSSSIERKRSRRSPAASAGTFSSRLAKRLRSGTPRRSAPDARLPLRRDEREKKRGDTDDDERVGEVEGGPEAEVEEVRHVADAQPVDEVSEAASDQQPERDREDRMAGARLREVEEHPDDGARREERDRGGPAREEAEGDSRVVHVPDPERADDVDRLTEPELRDDDLLGELVGRQRGERDGEEREPVERTSRQRALDHGDRNAAVRGRPDANVDQPR